MVFLQGSARAASPAGRCLKLYDRGTIELVVSPAVLAEIDDVLRRPQVRSKFPALTDELVDALLDDLRLRATVIDEVPELFQYERDPKDEPYINLALTSAAPYLVSQDKDLLDLMRSDDFTSRFPSLRVVTPPSFLLAAASSP